jgi:hypothetical protein
MAQRVTTGEKPKIFHANAKYAITSGGWALDNVECGMNDASLYMSYAAGM